MKIGDAKDGDIVKIGDFEYRLMIKFRGAWGCRYRDLGAKEWSLGHEILEDDHVIDEILVAQPVRKKGADNRSDRDSDPLLSMRRP